MIFAFGQVRLTSPERPGGRCCRGTHGVPFASKVFQQLRDRSAGSVEHQAGRHPRNGSDTGHVSPLGERGRAGGHARCFRRPLAAVVRISSPDTGSSGYEKTTTTHNDPSTLLYEKFLVCLRLKNLNLSRVRRCALRRDTFSSRTLVDEET